MNDSSKGTTDILGIVVLLCAALFFGSFCVIAWQVFQYLKIGEWPALSLLTVGRHFLGSFFMVLPWEYYGAYKIFYRILDSTPISFAMILFSIFMFFITAWISEKK